MDLKAPEKFFGSLGGGYFLGRKKNFPPGLKIFPQFFSSNVYFTTNFFTNSSYFTYYRPVVDGCREEFVTVIDFREVFPYILDKACRKQILRALPFGKILPWNQEFRSFSP